MMLSPLLYILVNRLPTVAHNSTPLEKLLDHKPDYSLLKTFGCLCYPTLRPFNNHKIDPQSTPCLFLGYSSIHKGYKCLSSSNRLYISRHVLFDEKKFPTSIFLSSHNSTSQPLTITARISFFPAVFHVSCYCFGPFSIT